jgi:hypothetical protein
MTVQRGRRDHHTIHMRSGPRLHGTSSTTRAKKAGAFGPRPIPHRSCPSFSRTLLLTSISAASTAAWAFPPGADAGLHAPDR